MAEQTEQSERLFSIHFTQRGDEITCSTKFHKKISGRELFGALSSAINGMVRTAISIGESDGHTKEEVIDLIFGKDN